MKGSRDEEWVTKETHEKVAQCQVDHERVGRGSQTLESDKIEEKEIYEIEDNFQKCYLNRLLKQYGRKI